jgi:hypothetical protein
MKRICALAFFVTMLVVGCTGDRSGWKDAMDDWNGNNMRMQGESQSPYSNTSRARSMSSMSD